MVYSLDSFGPEFWRTPGEPNVRLVNKRPTSIEQALWEVCFDGWAQITERFFPNRLPQDVDISEIMAIIRETNTCSNLDSPVEVWIDRKGDFKIKVYDVR